MGLLDRGIQKGIEKMDSCLRGNDGFFKFVSLSTGST